MVDRGSYFFSYGRRGIQVIVGSDSSLGQSGLSRLAKDHFIYPKVISNAEEAHLRIRLDFQVFVHGTVVLGIGEQAPQWGDDDLNNRLDWRYNAVVMIMKFDQYSEHGRWQIV
jgi:hypothetical protein